MTPLDHNKTLGIIFSFLGGLPLIGAIVELVRVLIRKNELSEIISEDLWIPISIGLLLMVMLLAAAYGVFKKRPWARILALILAGVFVFLFPLGTLLAVYIWWFMFSDGAKHLYSKSSSSF